ncbi:MAG: VCBS repeat-containing protein, partial [Myxococcota bacterium]|nr:VCBS repeat-containing protein [Myxococcota bacterium]
GEASQVIVAEAEDLLYLQEEDGTFTRGDVPFEPGSACLGRQAVLGDLNSDGLAEVLLGGGEQSSELWLNTTEVPEGTNALTLRFSPTVSTTPPTGALVTGTCGESTIHRHLDSGGKRGGMQAPEIYLAWPGCETIPQIDVTWPSGVKTSHAPEAGKSVLVAEEPLWWQVNPADPSSVSVSPVTDQIPCIGSDAKGWTCCEDPAEGCDLSVSALGMNRPLVRIGESRPMALPQQPTRWVLLTEPSPVRPGEPVTFTVRHQGDPTEFNPDPTALTLFIQSVSGASTSAPWTTIDEEHRSFEVEMTAPTEGGQINLSLFPLNLPPDPTWTVSTGQGIDPQWTWVDTYPWNLTGGITEVWNWEAFIVGLRHIAPLTSMNYLILSTPTGETIPFNGNHASPSVARVRITTSWEELVGLDHVVISDGGGSFSLTV